MTAPAPFRRRVTVRFGDCDPAAIVFYPRYVEMLNDTVEEWFESGLGHPWGRMHRTDHRGMPIVDLAMRFLKPSRLGEHLDVTLSVVELGRSAVTLAIVVDCAGERRLEARLKLVHSDLGGPKAVAIPTELRERMKAYLAAEATTREPR
jgi:4-hydroxybenzoyl-CoA thioesterase